MFKKLLVVSLVACMALFAGNAFAGQQCSGPDCEASGTLGMGVIGYGAGFDASGKLITQGGPISGAAGGLAIGGGFTAGQSLGYTNGGKISGDVFVVGGGAGGSDSVQWNPGVGDKSIGVYSGSQAVAQTGGSIKVTADAKKWYKLAVAEGTFAGAAGEATLNGSIVGPSPKFGWDSKGFSAGVAGQGAIGHVEGGAGVISFFGAPAEAGARADVFMQGNSYSESYRFIAWGDGDKTEGMRTNVGAFTTVESSGETMTKGLIGVAYVDGGWKAAGIAASLTVQNAPGLGGAAALAVGSYNGSGELGCNFKGSAVGYTSTSVRTFTDMNGSINSASAGMAVTAGTN